MRNSFYGDLPGRFDGTGGGLFKQVWWLWLATLSSWFAVVRRLALRRRRRPARLPRSSRCGCPFGYAIYKAIEWRWWVSGIRFGDVRFESKLADRALIDLYWKVIGWSWLIMIVLLCGSAVFGFGYLVARALGGAGRGSVRGARAELRSLVAHRVVVLGYLACALAFGVVMRMYLRRDVWARVVGVDRGP